VCVATVPQFSKLQKLSPNTRIWRDWHRVDKGLSYPDLIEHIANLVPATCTQAFQAATTVNLSGRILQSSSGGKDHTEWKEMQIKLAPDYESDLIASAHLAANYGSTLTNEPPITELFQRYCEREDKFYDETEGDFPSDDGSGGAAWILCDVCTTVPLSL